MRAFWLEQGFGGTAPNHPLHPSESNPFDGQLLTASRRGSTMPKRDCGEQTMLKRMAPISAAAVMFGSVMPSQAAAAADRCGWYVVLGCSRSHSGAERILTKLGGEGVGGSAGAHVVDNSGLPNFTPGWWCVVDGPYSRRENAEEIAWKEAVPDAYSKNGC